jgi:hypothetical protein
MEATIHVLDASTVSNYLTHDGKGTPTMITGTGCDDVNYKLNWMVQIERSVLPAGPEGVPPINYEQVKLGRGGLRIITRPTLSLLLLLRTSV